MKQLRTVRHNKSPVTIRNALYTVKWEKYVLRFNPHTESAEPNRLCFIGKTIRPKELPKRAKGGPLKDNPFMDLPAAGRENVILTDLRIEPPKPAIVKEEGNRPTLRSMTQLIHKLTELWEKSL